MDAGLEWVPRKRLSVGWAAMRMWLGFVLLFAGLGLAIANFSVSTADDGLGQIIENIQAEKVAPIEASRRLRSVAAGERRVVRGATEGGRVVHVAAAPWDRQEIFIGRQGGVVDVAEETDIPTDRYELARALQTELRRVGCYFGEIDGDWGSGSRRAMSGFTSRVNASLRVDTPDAIMLTMVRRFDGPACSGACRSGETFTGDRCVPSTVAAQQRTQTVAGADRALPPQNWNAVTEPSVSVPIGDLRTRTASVEPLPGRMSVGALDAAPTPVPVTREGSTATPPPINVDVRPRAETRSRSVQTYRSASRRKRWTETIFDDIASRR